MDFYKGLLYAFALVVSLADHFRTFVKQFLHFKDILVHYVLLFLHQFLPRRYFALERLPKHLAFSIADYYENLIDDGGGMTASLADLARLIFWCGRYGVEKVTIYDWRGVIADPPITKRLSDLVWLNITEKDAGYFAFSVNGLPYDGSNNDCGESISKSANACKGVAARKFELVTLDWRHGRRGIVEASRAFASDVKSGCVRVDGKNNNELNSGSALNEYLIGKCGVTPPDLVIEFGANTVGDSTCGYPPLALRVAEIIQVPKHRGMDELTFLECLQKYSHRDRRFGK